MFLPSSSPLQIIMEQVETAPEAPAPSLGQVLMSNKMRRRHRRVRTFAFRAEDNQILNNYKLIS